MGGVIWGWIGWIALDCVVLGDGWMEGCRGCDLEGEWEWELVLAWVGRDGIGDGLGWGMDGCRGCGGGGVGCCGGKGGMGVGVGLMIYHLVTGMLRME
jgi:hypothetical protein